jgi:CRISPR-associated protein Csm4
MITYRATLKPQSAALSPWQADTLFGHLCWLIRYEAGEAALAEWLAAYHSGSPPLLFSDGFPEGWLPRPLTPPRESTTSRKKVDQVRAMAAAKEAKGVRWVTLADFDALRRGEAITPQTRLWLKPDRTTLKNQINRLTGGTTAFDEAAGGNLYSVDELAFVDTSAVTPAGMNVSIYVRARDEAEAQRGRDLLTRLAQSGYGAKKSAGYGHFRLVNWEQASDFDTAPGEANGFISLSNWVPARSDPTEGFYSTLVKYGKLGEEWASSEKPFKFPLLMLTAGSSFYASPVREWYGRLVKGIAPANDRVVQYGYAFAVAAKLEAEG